MAPATELTDDPAFRRRVVRLTGTAAIALGIIWWLARVTVRPAPWITWALWAGWVLMPLVLALSLRRPLLRYALAVPSTLIGGALVVLCATSLPADATLRAGWLLVTGGILLGGVLGLWFWFRWAPVPAALDDPFSRGRWTLIALHVGLVVAGLVLVGLAQVE